MAALVEDQLSTHRAAATQEAAVMGTVSAMDMGTATDTPSPTLMDVRAALSFATPMNTLTSATTSLKSEWAKACLNQAKVSKCMGRISIQAIHLQSKKTCDGVTQTMATMTTTTTSITDKTTSLFRVISLTYNLVIYLLIL